MPATTTFSEAGGRLTGQWLRLFPASIASGIALAITSVSAAGDIDALLAKKHTASGVVATAVCDDASFLRRLSLDLIGRVPTEKELSRFLASPDRATAVDRLLSSDEHAEFWSQLWTTMLIGRGQSRLVEREVLRYWLHSCLTEEVPLNEMAFQLITAQGVTSLDGPVNFVAASRDDPVMRLSRTFLSVQLDCAQCHDHPYDRWTNEDYLAMKRFYSGTRFREVSGGVSVSDDVPDRGSPLPTFLTGRQPHTAAWRRELGIMVVSSKPFSRAMVNRTWHWLMGRGLIDPVDGLTRENPAAVPELLESLSAELRSSGYRLRPLIRKICLSKAYQRSPELDASPDSRELFASRTTRQMLPEQWIASLATVLDRPLPSASSMADQARRLLATGRGSLPADDPFVWTPTTQTLIRQLAGEIPPPLRDLDSLFRITLAREPSESERQLFSRQRSQEIVFALVHGNEFLTND